MFDFGVLDTATKRIAAAVSVVAAIAGLITALYQVKQGIYQDGYDKAVADVQEQQNNLTQERFKELSAEMKDALSAQDKLHKLELERVKKSQATKVLTETVIKYVDKIVVKNECTGLAADTIRLLGQATGIVSGSAGNSGSEAGSQR